MITMIVFKYIKLFLYTALFVITIVACKDKTSTEPIDVNKVSAEQIKGKWLVNYFIVNGKIITKNKIATYGIVFEDSKYKEIDSNNNPLSSGKWNVNTDIIELQDDSTITKDKYKFQFLDSVSMVFSNISSSSPTYQQFFVRAK